MSKRIQELNEELHNLKAMLFLRQAELNNLQSEQPVRHTTFLSHTNASTVPH